MATREELEYTIATYKQLLSQTDYKALKHSEGQISDEEYMPIAAQRQEWRDIVNEAQRELDNLEPETDFAPLTPESELEPEVEPTDEPEPGATDLLENNGEW